MVISVRLTWRGTEAMEAMASATSAAASTSIVDQVGNQPTRVSIGNMLR